MHDLAHVLDRIHNLRRLNVDTLSERQRIRDIMNGGADGIAAVMAWDQGKGSSSRRNADLGVDLPTVNLMASGLDRAAQQIGRVPTLKAPFADDEKVRARFQKRIDVVKGWDHHTRFEMQFPQVGRWLPGYSYATWVIRQGRTPDGTPFPVAELRDPFDVYPGWFGADQQPAECAVVRMVPVDVLEAAYGNINWKTAAEKLGGATNAMRVSSYGSSRNLSWEGNRSAGVEVVEYYDASGCYYVIPELEEQLSFIPNPLESGPAFVFAKRYSFDRPVSQYHHVIGLMGMMAKLNILGLIAAEDSVFRETNIIGELESGTYDRGRFAVNMFSPGSRIEKPVGDLQQQVWSQIDRLERQLRIGAAYDVAQDAISPNSFATGQAIRELGSASAANIREYQVVLRHAVERLDAKRLEWAESMWSEKRHRIFDMSGSTSEWYRPSRDIKGDYRTRRIFGAMATFDDAQKVVVGLQLLQGGIIDVETLQEHIDGLEDITAINERRTAQTAQETLFARLAARSEQDPAADAALVEIMENPSKRNDILKKYFTPQEPEMSPEEQAFVGQPGQALPETPPPVTTVLSQVEQGGGVEGGVQTVGRL